MAGRTKLSDFTKDEAAFREHTRKWILHTDEGFRKVEATKVAESKPIRHPQGKEFNRHSREYLWRDALWCQDRHSEPFELFFYDGEDPYDDEFFSEMIDSQGCETPAGQAWEWLTNIFNEEFVKALPELKHVLEG